MVTPVTAENRGREDSQACLECLELLAHLGPRETAASLETVASLGWAWRVLWVPLVRRENWDLLELEREVSSFINEISKGMV